MDPILSKKVRETRVKPRKLDIKNHRDCRHKLWVALKCWSPLCSLSKHFKLQKRVQGDWESPRASLYSNLALFQDILLDVKSAAMLFYNLKANRYDLRLSNELLFIIIAQGAAKLWLVKVGGLKTRSYAGVLEPLFIE